MDVPSSSKAASSSPPTPSLPISFLSPLISVPLPKPPHFLEYPISPQTWLLPKWAVSLRGLSPASFHHCGQERGDAECKVEDRMARTGNGRRTSHLGLQIEGCFLNLTWKANSHPKDHFLAKNPSFIDIRDSHSSVDRTLTFFSSKRVFVPFLILGCLRGLFRLPWQMGSHTSSRFPPSVRVYLLGEGWGRIQPHLCILTGLQVLCTSAPALEQSETLELGKHRDL